MNNARTRKFRTRVISFIAMLALVAGTAVFFAPPAGAYIVLTSWKWNSRNITVQDIKGDITYMEPGTVADTKLKQKRVYLQGGCYGNWSPADKGMRNPLKPGWNTLTTYRQNFGGKIYLFNKVGTPNKKQCNRA